MAMTIKAEFYPGVHLNEISDTLRQTACRIGPGHGNYQCFASSNVADYFQPIFKRGKGSSAIVPQAIACFCEGQSSRVTREQHHTQMFLQRFDLARQCALRDSELGGGTDEIEMPSRSLESAQSAKRRQPPQTVGMI